jgi:hypothetical protein
MGSLGNADNFAVLAYFFDPCRYLARSGYLCGFFFTACKGLKMRFMTVKELRVFLDGIPENAEVAINAPLNRAVFGNFFLANPVYLQAYPSEEYGFFYGEPGDNGSAAAKPILVFDMKRF